MAAQRSLNNIIFWVVKCNCVFPGRHAQFWPTSVSEARRYHPLWVAVSRWLMINCVLQLHIWHVLYWYLTCLSFQLKNVNPYCQYKNMFVCFVCIIICRIAGHPLAQNERCLHMFLQEESIDRNYIPGKVRQSGLSWRGWGGSNTTSKVVCCRNIAADVVCTMSLILFILFSFSV